MTVDWPYAEGRGRPASRRGAGATPLVLVVEDHTLISVLMRDTLQSYGYRVLIAQDAQAGIRLAWALRPDVILMDICLPGMSGLEATRIIKSNPTLRQIPIVAVTAHAMSGDQEKILEGGCEGYLSKPFRMAELAQVVEETLKKRPGPRLLPPAIEDLPQAS